MADYAIGDIQGCYEPLVRLLDQVNFDPTKDTLYSVGDIVNRGPSSLETLRFLYNLGDACKMVLGNHDLHLLALYRGVKSPNKKDTLNDILNAPDSGILCAWLQQQPLLRVTDKFAIVHAGIPPIWSLEKSLKLANEVESILASTAAPSYFSAMYGNTPAVWSDQLQGPERWRVITNYFTRMRFCDASSHLDFIAKGPANIAPNGYAPWYSFNTNHPVRILFGHWASLEGEPVNDKYCALDTGCVWGGPLRLLNIDTGQLYHWAG